jgi:hypothetical protein
VRGIFIVEGGRVTPSHRQRAKEYRDRAAEIRAVATTMSGHESRTVMFGIADSYERMACQLEDANGSSIAAGLNDGEE